MKILGGTFVSNQEQIQYPLREVVRGLGFCDEIFVFGSTDSDCMHAAKDLASATEPTFVHKLGVGINESHDIALAADAALTKLQTLPHDLIVLVHADVVLTSRVETVIRRDLSPEFFKDRALVAEPHLIWLHHHTMREARGAYLIGKGYRGAFQNPHTCDGAQPWPYGSFAGALADAGYNDPTPHAYDIGNATSAMLARKQKAHGALLKSFVRQRLASELSQLMAFMLFAYGYGHSIAPELRLATEPEYLAILERLEALDDHLIVRETIYG
jgi:hypothetical protein